jgi:hypothetical protein
MNSKRGRLKHISYLTVIGLFLLVFPFASPGVARGRGHEEGYGLRSGGRVIHVYPGYTWDWGLGWGWRGDPFWDGYWPAYYSTTGTLKLKNVSKSDEIYLNGSYVGGDKNSYSMDLDPGSYAVEVKNNGKNVFARKVYVIRGRTTELQIGDKDGTIKLKDAAKNDSVYIDGRDQGEISDMDNASITLRPGTYRVTIKNNGLEVFNQKVTLATDQTLTLSVGDAG